MVNHPNDGHAWRERALYHATKAEELLEAVASQPHNPHDGEFLMSVAEVHAKLALAYTHMSRG